MNEKEILRQVVELEVVDFCEPGFERAYSDANLLRIIRRVENCVFEAMMDTAVGEDDLVMMEQNIDEAKTALQSPSKEKTT